MLEKTYTIHWDGRAPEQITIYPINFDSGDWLRLGLCYPPGTTFQVRYQLEMRVPSAIFHNEEIHPAQSLHEVESGDGKLFYFEESTGLLFLKARAKYDREGHNYCSHMGCERIIISATMTSNTVSDCTAAAYPTYSLTPTETVPMPSFADGVFDCSGCGAPEPIVSVDNMRFLEVTVLSAGWLEIFQGHKSYIESAMSINQIKLTLVLNLVLQIDGVRHGNNHRGYHVISVDALTGDVTRELTFDTHSSPASDVAMADFIRNDIASNSIVLVATSDEPSQYAVECLVALKEIGAQEPVKTGNRGNFAMVGFKGTVWPSWIQQVNLPSGQGPAQIYTKIPLMG
ncbi:cell surface hyaluronidase-like [Branchiostoma floridae]|uniref:Cell surface hyaluronidase-like n=1 Tax=Branchiostoma floridae TaxID=7739 RepID=A0A9J7MJR5_BRAFL|nr:cell surface hyaluronidase-like [Branchiostoma floridae]